MLHKKDRRLVAALLLLLALLGTTTIGPRLVAVEKAITPQQLHLLACGYGQAPPCE